MASNSGFQPLSANPGISSFLNVTSWPGFLFLNTSRPGWTICDFEIVLIFAKIACKLAPALLGRDLADQEKSTYRFLISQHLMHFNVFDLWQHPALHDGSTFVIFDISDPSLSVERNLFRESLFSEISNGVIIRISKEIIDSRMSGADMIFERVHEV